MSKDRRKLQNRVKEFILSGNNKSVDILFLELAIDIFKYQVKHCKPYAEFVGLLEVNPELVKTIEDIPFLPVKFFKSRNVYSCSTPPEIVFTSSATSGMVPSKHPVADLSLYQLSFNEAFRLFYGNPQEYNILALLPSYLEREGSSLVFMVDTLIKESKSDKGGFYLYDYEKLAENLIRLRGSNRKTILLGVSFALMDFANNHKIDLPELIIMETGGMKGRGPERSREEIHQLLKDSFGVNRIHSEYGMAELLSQSYSDGEGLFKTPHWMKFMLRDFVNPFKIIDSAERGGLNIIDLANINSCSFIETEDIGIKTAENLWKIPGRITNSEIRGCNLLLG